MVKIAYSLLVFHKEEKLGWKFWRKLINIFQEKPAENVRKVFSSLVIFNFFCIEIEVTCLEMPVCIVLASILKSCIYTLEVSTSQ